jgi:RNA polymerase sigma-70 factor (ECF subfamily)
VFQYATVRVSGLNWRGRLAVRGSSDPNRLKEYLLVLRCQSGDEAAFTELFERFHQRTLRYLEGLLGTNAAPDAQQEVWLSVFQGVSKLANPGAFRTWLYQITRFQAIDIIRKEKRQSELLAEFRNEFEGVFEGMEYSLDRWDQKSLESALAQLSSVHYEVLFLRFWEEMSYVDIALISGCSVGTVRSRLHHAKKRLCEFLIRQGVEPRKRKE